MYLVVDKVKLFPVLLLAYIFNLADGILTYVVVCHYQLADEANPVMDFLLWESPAAFFVSKLVVPFLALSVIWVYGDQNPRMAQVLAIGAMAIYAIVVAMHMWILL